MTDEEISLLRRVESTLNGIIQGCVHPDIAIRAVFVDLKPIRETLKEIKKVLDNPPLE
jgi:hypothetical protein